MALSDSWSNMKLSLWFTSIHRANWKENVVVYQKSFGALFQAPLQLMLLTWLVNYVTNQLWCDCGTVMRYMILTLTDTTFFPGGANIIPTLITTLHYGAYQYNVNNSLLCSKKSLTILPSFPVSVMPPLWTTAGLSKPSIDTGVPSGGVSPGVNDEPKNVTCCEEREKAQHKHMDKVLKTILNTPTGLFSEITCPSIIAQAPGSCQGQKNKS